MNPKSLNLIKSVVVVGALFGFVAIASAGTWTAPTSTPPAGNVDAPINIGTTAQTKNGAIAMTGLANYGTSALVGSVAIGDSSTPATSDMLSVAGVSQLFGELQLLSTIQIAGGSPAVGRVLTATDTSGDATWQTPATSTGLTAVAHDTTLTGAGTVASPLKVVGGGGGGITGSGTANVVPEWTSATALGNSNMTISGSTVGVAGSLSVVGGESHFANGSYTDPEPGTAAAIKATSMATGSLYVRGEIPVYTVPEDTADGGPCDYYSPTATAEGGSLFPMGVGGGGLLAAPPYLYCVYVSPADVVSGGLVIDGSEPAVPLPLVGYLIPSGTL